MMAALQDTPLRIPDQWSAAWFRQFVIEVLAKADVRNAVGDGATITSTGNSVATISTKTSNDESIASHNLDPFAHSEAIGVHSSQPDPHPAYARHVEVDEIAFFLGE